MKRARRHAENQDFHSTYFRKIFHFQKSNEWTLPPEVYRAQRFKIPELQDFKCQLNRVKGKLSQFDLSKWSSHTRNRDVAGFVINQLKKKINPELLTQAWCKFYELVSSFPLVRSYESSVFTSLHLCEAPGAFVCALNHFLVINYPNISWKWSANTLNPDYEGNESVCMIPDDRLIRYTRDKWHFGIDLTGDIQMYYNHCDIVSKTTLEGKVQLVTADGSIDCMNDPGEQEKLVEYLHYCETMTALAVLKKGGSFVLKIFTIFEDSTICLLYLLNCIFAQVFVFKPRTSKGGNSEVYVVCIDFYGFEVIAPIWKMLIEPYERGFFQETISMFSVNAIPYSFQVQLISCCADFFLEKQISTIEENIYYFLNPNNTNNAGLHHLKTAIANHYISKYRLKPIPEYRRVVPEININEKKINFCTMETPERTFSLKGYCFNKYLDIKYGKQINFVNYSLFASKGCLLYLDLVETVSPEQNLSGLYSLVLNHIKSTSVVINVNEFKLIPYFNYQKLLFFNLFSAVTKEKHIILINVPFHTHFLAALWCIVASAFEKIYYGVGWTVFYKPCKEMLQTTKDTLSMIQNAYNHCSYVFPSDIVYIFPPEVFQSDLSFIPGILNKCNTFFSST